MKTRGFTFPLGKYLGKLLAHHVETACFLTGVVTSSRDRIGVAESFSEGCHVRGRLAKGEEGWIGSLA